MISIDFTYKFTLVLYKQLMQTGFVLMLLPLSSVLGFSLYEDTVNGRAAIVIGNFILDMTPTI